VTLNEGNTPLVRADRLASAICPGIELFLKLEGQNPTGSFKDRGMTVAVTRAVSGRRGSRHLRVDGQHVRVGRGVRGARRHPRVRRRARGEDRARQALAGRSCTVRASSRSPATSTRRSSSCAT
jgi:hypothetical protein